jgi:septal ring factor EnvC (AmiA/AmiB activator)
MNTIDRDAIMGIMVGFGQNVLTKQEFQREFDKVKNSIQTQAENGSTIQVAIISQGNRLHNVENDIGQIGNRLHNVENDIGQIKNDIAALNIKMSEISALLQQVVAHISGNSQ